MLEKSQCGLDTGRDEEGTHTQLPSGVRSLPGEESGKLLWLRSWARIPLEALHYQQEDAKAPQTGVIHVSRC